MAEEISKEEALQQELEIALTQQKRLQNMKKLLKAQEESEERSRKISRVNKLLSKTYIEQTNLKKELTGYQTDETTAIVKQSSIYDNINNTLSKNKQEVQDAQNYTKSNLGLEKEALATQQNKNEELQKSNSLADKYADQLSNSLSSLNSQIESLPGGGFLAGALGVDDLQKSLSSSLSEGLQSGDMSGMATNISTAFSNVKSSIMSTLGVLGIFIASVGLIFSLFKSIHDQTKDVSQSLGVSAAKSREMVDQSRAWTGGMTTGLATQKDILESQKAVVQTYGTMFDMSKRTVDTVTSLNKAFGVSNETAAGVVKTFEQLGASVDQANSISVFTANLSEAAGIPVGTVMEDVAQNAEFAAKHFAGMPNQLAKAAVEANRLGLSLSDVSQMTEGILDIQGSLEKEMQAQVMLGKQINFDEARRLTLMNKPVEAAKSMLNQMGGISEFSKMDLLQREAIAEATGVSVDKLTEYARRQEKINNLSAEQQSAYDQAKKDLEELNKSQEKSIVKNKEQELALSRMSAAWSEIKVSISNIIVPLADLLLPIFQGIADTVSYISETTGQRWAGGLAIIAVGFLPKIIKGFGKMGGMIGGVTGKMTNLLSKSKKFQKIDLPGAKKGGGMFGKLNQMVSKIDPKKLLAVGAAMVLVAGSVWILSKAMQNFSEGVTWEGVLMGITSLFALTAAVAALGALMMSGVGAVAIMAGAAAMAIMAGGIWILSKALENFSAYSGSLLTFFKELSQIDGRGLFVVAGGIGAISAALAAFSASSVMGAISSSFSKLFGGGFVNQLEKLSGMSDDLKIVASSIDLIASSLTRLSDIDIGGVVNSLNDIDPEMGIIISQNQESVGVGYKDGSAGQVQKEVMQTTTNQYNTVQNNNTTANQVGGGEQDVSYLLQKLIDKVDSPVYIKVGNKVINELTKQQTMKKNIQFGFD